MATLTQILSVFTVAYPNIGLCILSSSKSEHLIDTSGGYTVFSTSGIEAGFDVINPNKITFDMLQIDNKLIVGQKGGQCDCAFFYDDAFNFLEFKTNVTSLKHVRKKYKRAEDQISNTIKTFISKGIDVKTLASSVSAHICFNNSFPRKKANEMSRAIQFANNADTKGIGLYFENKVCIL